MRFKANSQDPDLQADAALSFRSTLSPLLCWSPSLSDQPEWAMTVSSSCDMPWPGHLTSERTRTLTEFSSIDHNMLHRHLFFLGFLSERTFQQNSGRTFCSHMHTCAHTHTHTHRLVHTHTHTHTHTYINFIAYSAVMYKQLHTPSKRKSQACRKLTICVGTTDC